MRGRLFLIAVLVAVLGLTACGPKAVRVAMLVPARVDGVAGLRQIAVLPFEGDLGDEMTSRVESLIANVQIQGRPFFTPVDRSQINRVLAEQRFALSASVDPQTAVRIGEMVGAQAFVSGNAASDVNDRRYQNEVTVCVRKDREGNCAKWGQKRIQCVERTARVDVTFRIVDTSRGTVVYSRPIGSAKTSRACRGDGGILGEPANMYARCINDIVEEFRKDIAPYQQIVSIELMKADEPVKVDEMLEKRFDGAVDYSNAGRMDRACEILAECGEELDESAAVQYNLGVCAEVRGDLTEAVRLYRLADDLIGRPDDLITAALKRVLDRQKKVERLKKQIQAD